MRVIKYSLTTAAIALAAPVGAQTVADQSVGLEP